MEQVDIQMMDQYYTIKSVQTEKPPSSLFDRLKAQSSVSRPLISCNKAPNFLNAFTKSGYNLKSQTKEHLTVQREEIDVTLTRNNKQDIVVEISSEAKSAKELFEMANVAKKTLIKEIAGN